MAPILKHEPELHQRPCLWILAGTGEGPGLADALLQQGWRVRVSLVSVAAALAYRQQLQCWSANRLELRLGPLQGPSGIAQELQQRPCAVVDATHPFATRVSQDLAQVCAHQRLPLLRLKRELLPLDGALVLRDLNALGDHNLAGERLLLALGSRHLAKAIACSPGALHHARVLPNPAALQQALAAGLAPERLACLRPSAEFAVEAALMRHWRISTIVCRQSGGLTEAGWHHLAASCGCRLLLLQRPPDNPAVPALLMADLLARLDGLFGALGHG